VKLTIELRVYGEVKFYLYILFLIFIVSYKKRFVFRIFYKWGLGIGDWGLGIGDWGLGPIPNPQSPSPIPNPQSFFYLNHNYNNK
jgi:hypothetical protein